MENVALLKDVQNSYTEPDLYNTDKPVKNASSTSRAQSPIPDQQGQYQPAQQPQYQPAQQPQYQPAQQPQYQQPQYQPQPQPQPQFQQQQQQQQPMYLPQPIMAPTPGIFQVFNVFSPNGQLAVYTDKPYYVGGELITGRVMASVLQPISCRSVCVQVLGYEKTEWNVLSTRQIPIHGTQPQRYRIEHHLKRHRGRRSFFNVTIIVNNLNNGVLNPGQYIFPFQYQLPDNLPGSFYERREFQNLPHIHVYDDDNCYGVEFCDSDDNVDELGNILRTHHQIQYRRPELLAVVHYKMRAVIDVNGVFSPNLRASAPIIIHPRLAQDVRPASASLEKDVMVCCCINKGKCKLDAHFDKNSYVPGEVAMIIGDVNNQSKKPLVMVVKLWRTLKLKSANDHHKIETVVAIEQRYEGIPALEKKVQNMPLPIPVALKPTTTGDFVQCSYQYTVECQVSWGGDIKLGMPVVIYAPQPPADASKPLF